MCEKNKFDRVFVYYLDGVGKVFVEHFLKWQKMQNHFTLNEVYPYGLADSKPMFYNLFSGKTAFNYEVSLYEKDHLFW